MDIEQIRFFAHADLLPSDLQELLLTFRSAEFTIDASTSEVADALIVHAARVNPADMPADNLVMFGSPEEIGAIEAAPQVIAAMEWPSSPEAVQRMLGRSSRWLKRERQLKSLALRDPLTGLLNRRGFEEQAERRLARARLDRERSAVLLIDLDHFKKVNDGHGHAAGDAVLRHIGALIPQLVRGCDIVGRIGGEEIAVVLPAVSAASARETAERLRAAIAGTVVRFDNIDLRVTASIGVGFTGVAGDHVVAMREADEALYAAKGRGRNQVVGATGDQGGDILSVAAAGFSAAEMATSLFAPPGCAAAA